MLKVILGDAGRGISISPGRRPYKRCFLIFFVYKPAVYKHVQTTWEAARCAALYLFMDTSNHRNGAELRYFRESRQQIIPRTEQRIKLLNSG